MTDAAILLLGLVVGAVLQAITGALTDRRAAKRERATWLLDKREAAFVGLMGAAHACATAAYRDVGKDESFERFSEAIIPAQVYAPSVDAVVAITDIKDELGALYRQPRGQRDRARVRDALRAYDHIVRSELEITLKGETPP
jgi:hypothetical protein